MFAVVEIGGKQYKVTAKQQLAVDYMADQKEGSEIEIDKVLLTSKENGDSLTVGKPYTGSTIKAKVIEHIKGEKVTVFKFIAKKRHAVKNGHRQKYTVLEVGDIK